jgi:formylglycine-generating enzyme required for sulfatase activity
MAGNVWEWCHSLYKSYPYKADDGREEETASGRRVLRGGSFLGGRGLARCACRLHYDVGDLRYNIGFRVAASPFLS